MIININDINSDSISTLIKNKFNQVNENITSMKILAILGIPIHDQKPSLQLKRILYKIKTILKELSLRGEIEIKTTTHDTLGIKEVAYKKLSLKII